MMIYTRICLPSVSIMWLVQSCYMVFWLDSTLQSALIFTTCIHNIYRHVIYTSSSNYWKGKKHSSTSRNHPWPLSFEEKRELPKVLCLFTRFGQLLLLHQKGMHFCMSLISLCLEWWSKMGYCYVQMYLGHSSKADTRYAQGLTMW